MKAAKRPGEHRYLLASSGIIIMMVCAGLAGGVFLRANPIGLAVIAVALFLAGSFALTAVDSSLKQFMMKPARALADRVKGYVKGADVAALEQDPVAGVGLIVDRIKTGADTLQRNVAAFQKAFELLPKAATQNSLLAAIATSLKMHPGIDAGLVFLINREKKAVVVVPLFPEGLSAKEEFALGKDGVRPEQMRIAAPVYKAALAKARVRSQIEEVLLENGCQSSLVTAIVSGEGEQFGLLAIGSKRENALTKDDQVFAESLSSFAALRLMNLRVIAEIRRKSDELSAYQREGKEKIEKQLEELKTMYNQVVQAGKMASMGQLAAGVAHEINNPIGGILGYTQLILAKLKNEDVKRQDIDTSVKYLEMMEKEEKRCQWIVSNLLNFARKPLDERLEVDVKDIIENTVSMMEFQLSKSNVKCELSFPPEGLKKVMGNANELQQVFTNLIQNADDAMPNGGVITVTGTNKADQQYHPPLEYIELTFADQGCGIPQDQINRIFEPFFSSKVGKAGTGLGLSISYAIISSHKGAIKVDSEVGKGTTFTIVLPAVKAAAT